jgi:hypothetical protein
LEACTTIYCWKGVENPFPKVYYTSPNLWMMEPLQGEKSQHKWAEWRSTTPTSTWHIGKYKEPCILNVVHVNTWCLFHWHMHEWFNLYTLSKVAYYIFETIFGGLITFTLVCACATPTLCHIIDIIHVEHNVTKNII